MFTSARTFSRNGWTAWHLVAAVTLAALGVAVTFEAWADIYQIARTDEESSQVFLAVIVCAWLVWVRRARLRTLRPTNAMIGPALIAVGWAMHGLGDRHLVQSFWHGGAVLILIGCLLSVAGIGALLRFMPAFAVLGFLVPVPGLVRQQIALPLQNAQAQVTQAAFELMGMSVQRAGNVLSVNGIDVAIAEACNGLRMVFALTLVSFAFAFGTPLRGYARAIVIAASPVLAILVNAVRMLPTVWLYGYYPTNVADVFHDVSGWVMLPIAFVLLMGILAALRWAMVPVTRYTLAYD